MKPRLERYHKFITEDFSDRLLQENQYQLKYMNDKLLEKISSGKITRIIFTGMGCSAIVADIVKSFFVSEGIPVFVEVVNDYHLDFFLHKERFNNQTDLVIISSYSGYSTEPILAYKKFKKLTKNILFITSGGELEKLGEIDKVSTYLWSLTNPDREYPLWHAGEFFVILLQIFFEGKILNRNYRDEIKSSIKFMEKNFTEKQINTAQNLSKNFHGKDIILLANPKWYVGLLKLVKMHLNEIAMVPAHKNYIHEFGHSEIGILNNPSRSQALWIFKSEEEDSYTEKKLARLKQSLTKNIPENQNIFHHTTFVGGDNFFQQFFSTLLFVQYVTYFLGHKNSINSRELISYVSGNDWYSAENF